VHRIQVSGRVRGEGRKSKSWGRTVRSNSSHRRINASRNVAKAGGKNDLEGQEKSATRGTNRDASAVTAKGFFAVDPEPSTLIKSAQKDVINSGGVFPREVTSKKY